MFTLTLASSADTSLLKGWHSSKSPLTFYKWQQEPKLRVESKLDSEKGFWYNEWSRNTFPQVPYQTRHIYAKACQRRSMRVSGALQYASVPGQQHVTLSASLANSYGRKISPVVTNSLCHTLPAAWARRCTNGAGPPGVTTQSRKLWPRREPVHILKCKSDT